MIIENEFQNMAMRSLHTALKASRMDVIIIKDLPDGTTQWLDVTFQAMIADVEARIEQWEKSQKNKP